MIWKPNVPTLSTDATRPACENREFKKLCCFVERLRSFHVISVRDENSQSIVREAIGREVPLVLDPCLQFPINASPVRHPPREPYVALYGYRFSEPFARAVQKWARTQRLPTISIGYRNRWADQNWLTAGPDDFANFMSRGRCRSQTSRAAVRPPERR